MAPLHSGWVWNPYKALNLTPGANNFICVGVAPSQKNSRCRWDIQPRCLDAAFDILDNMAQNQPSSEVIQLSLPKVAAALLCTEIHQGQKNKQVRDWTELINDYLIDFNERKALFSQVRQMQEDLDRLRLTSGRERQDSDERGKLLSQIRQLEDQSRKNQHQHDSFRESHVNLIQKHWELERQLKELRSTHEESEAQSVANLETLAGHRAKDQASSDAIKAAQSCRIRALQDELNTLAGYRAKDQISFDATKAAQSCRIRTLQDDLETLAEYRVKDQVNFDAMKEAQSCRIRTLQDDLETLAEHRAKDEASSDATKEAQSCRIRALQDESEKLKTSEQSLGSTVRDLIDVRQQLEETRTALITCEAAKSGFYESVVAAQHDLSETQLQLASQSTQLAHSEASVAEMQNQTQDAKVQKSSNALQAFFRKANRVVLRPQ